MAMADYYKCDVCGGKSLYDANIATDDDGNYYGVGDIAVLCKECATSHKVVVQGGSIAAQGATLNERIAALAAPVSDEEWAKKYDDFVMNRLEVDRLIAARANKQ